MSSIMYSTVTQSRTPHDETRGYLSTLLGAADSSPAAAAADTLLSAVLS